MPTLESTGVDHNQNALDFVEAHKGDGLFGTETFRGITNEAFRIAQEEIENLLTMTVLSRWHWEWVTRGLSPDIAHREAMEKLDAVLEAVKTELSLRIESYGEQWSVWR